MFGFVKTMGLLKVGRGHEQGMRQVLLSGEDKVGICPSSFQKEPCLLTPWLQPSIMDVGVLKENQFVSFGSLG